MLVEMLNQSESFHTLPKPKQQIFLILAHNFIQSTEHLFADPEELVSLTDSGTKEQWHEFLTLQEVQNYVKGQMGFLAQISQRKTFRSLVTMALSGGQGAQAAAKQVQELSGVLNQQDSNKIVVLHSIPRPK